MMHHTHCIRNQWANLGPNEQSHYFSHKNDFLMACLAPHFLWNPDTCNHFIGFVTAETKMKARDYLDSLAPGCWTETWVTSGLIQVKLCIVFYKLYTAITLHYSCIDLTKNCMHIHMYTQKKHTHLYFYRVRMPLMIYQLAFCIPIRVFIVEIFLHVVY